MSKSNAFETSLLLLIFNGTAIADLAENDTTTPATTLAVALHTADPGEAGTMATNEANYGGYVRKTVARSGAGWVVTANSVSPAAAIDFAEATSGTNTITHFHIGTGVANNLMYSGTVTPNIVVTTGVTPRISASSTITED